MKSNIKNRKNLIILGIILLVIVIIGGCAYFIKSKNQISSYKRYSASIIVESISKDEQSKKTETIDIRDNGKVAEVLTSFIKLPIYINREGLFYEDGGRYNNIKSEYSYRDIYKILNDTFKNYQDGNYHPDITKETVNKILDCLFIDYEMNRDTVSNLTVKNGKIEEFSLYLRNFYGYEKIGFVVTFEELDKNYEINSPKFYKDATDEVEEMVLRFIN